MNPYLFPALELGPKTLERLLQRMSPSQWDVQLDIDRFTPREAVAHLLDWEPILREERMRAALDQPGVAIQAHDEGERATVLNYATWDPIESAARFRLERARTIELARDLTPEQWATTFFHPERGHLTVYDLANMLIGHDTYHIEDLSRYL